MPEQVLVFDARLIDCWNKDAPDGVLTNPFLLKRYSDLILNSKDLRYMDRERAETDPVYKQVIPYIVVRQGGLYFCYRRTKKAGERRLHNQWSIGLGGHINPKDGHSSDPLAYEMGFFRELQEEAGILLKNFHSVYDTIVAMVYDDSTEVGRVHFGVVHLLDVPRTSELSLADRALAQGQFASLDVLRRERGQYESWSRMVIDHVLPGQPALPC